MRAVVERREVSRFLLVCKFALLAALFEAFQLIWCSKQKKKKLNNADAR